MALALIAGLGLIWVFDHDRGALVALVATSTVFIVWLSRRLERDRGRAKLSQQHFNQLFENTAVPAMVIRVRDHHYVAVNNTFVRCLGYTRAELIGRTSDAVGLLRDAGTRAGLMERVARDGAVCDQEIIMLDRDRREHVMMASGAPITLEGDAHVLVTLVDRTRQVQAERSERESEDRFAKAFAASPVASIVVRSADRLIIEVNEAGVRMFGFGREELVGKCADVVGFYVRDADRELVMSELARSGRVQERPLQLRTKTGAIIDGMWSAERIEVDGKPHTLHVVQDVTDRKRAEAALVESEARFRDVTEAIREVFWLTDESKQEMLYISPGYEIVWGRTCADLMSNPMDWIAAIHPDDRERVMDAAHTRQASGEYDEVYRIQRPDNTIRHIRDRAFPVRDEAGKVVRIAGLAEDITDQLALEDQLRQAQKLESLGLLAGGIAHDFNNMLAVIASCSGMLEETMPKDHADRELVEEIDHAVQRATSLTRQLLAFSRKQVTEPVVLDINACVNDTRKMLRRMVGEDIVLTTSLEPEVHNVKVDPGYLVQVIMNLVVNARDAMPKGGMLDLTTRNAAIDDALAARHPRAQAGSAVMLAVRDTGCGMPAEVLSRVFEPFFTTKPVGRGTGMGLAVVQGIVEQAGGCLEIESTVGVGTTFRIYLPATDAALASAHSHTTAIALGVETLLVVDDDAYVRRSAARALRMRGYTVLEAGGGEAALALMAVEPKLSLMVTDVVMPGMDGRELAELTHERFPAIKVLYTSGYTDDAVVRHGVMQGEVELIEKPFRIETLATKVRQMLDAV